MADGNRPEGITTSARLGQTVDGSVMVGLGTAVVAVLTVFAMLATSTRQVL